MTVEYRSTFLKDIKKIRDGAIKVIICDVIENARQAKVISNITLFEGLAVAFHAGSSV